MKKYLFILGLVGTALFTACSTADDLVAEKPIETPPVEEPKETALIVDAGQNSEVPIALGIGQSRGYTRAVLDPDPTSVDPVTGYGSISLADGEYLRVFCLASGTQSNVSNIPTTVSTNLWNTDAGGGLGGLLVKMNDVPAKVSSDNVSFLDENAFPTETSKKYYYPMGNWMTYNFYGYYPKLVVEGHPELSQTTTITANTVEVSNYLIDGSQDLIWGRAHPEDAETVTGANDADPYCAKYIRMKRNEEGVGEANIAAHYPKLKFEHQFVQFNFFVKAALKDPTHPEDHTILTTLHDNLHARVTKMYIDNAINKLKFNVAKQVANFDNYDDCQLTKDGDLDAVTTQLGIKMWGANFDRFDQDGDGTPDNSLTIRTDNDVVSTKYAKDGYMGYIMLPSPNVEVSGSASFRYRLIVKIEGDWNPAGEEVGISIEPPLVPGTGTDPETNPKRYEFLAGHSYNVIVRVQSPEKIFATAVLQEWETYEDPENNNKPYIEYGND